MLLFGTTKEICSLTQAALGGIQKWLSHPQFFPSHVHLSRLMTFSVGEEGMT